MRLMQAALNRNASRISFRAFSKKVDSKKDSTKEDKDKLIKPEIEYKDAKPFKSIPGPTSFPLIGTLYSYYWPINKYAFKTLHLTYEKMYKEYGLIVKERQTPKRLLVHLFAAEDIAKVYQNDGRQPMRMSHQALGKYRRERPQLYTREGLLSSNHDAWENFRKLFQDELSGGSTYLSYLPALEDVVDEMVATFPKRLDENNEISILPLFYKFGLESIGRMAVNKRIGCLEINRTTNADAMIVAAEETHIATYMTENLHIRKKKYHRMLEKAQDCFVGIVKGYFDEAMQNLHKEEYRNTMLGKILERNPTIDIKDVFTIMVDAFLGGIDNTSCALTMALYNIARHPEVQETLKDEIMRNMPSKDTRLTSLKPQEWKRKEIDAVLAESHRMTPATLANGRITQKDLVLSGYQVPAGTLVLLQHQVASLLDRHFPEPHIFKPDRFYPETLAQSTDEEDIAAYAAKPFGSGTRLCIGFRIAKSELTLAISKILRNYKLTYHHEPVGFHTILMNKPDKPVNIRFHKRGY